MVELFTQFQELLLKVDTLLTLLSHPHQYGVTLQFPPPFHTPLHQEDMSLTQYVPTSSGYETVKYETSPTPGGADITYTDTITSGGRSIESTHESSTITNSYGQVETYIDKTTSHGGTE